ncbi:39S ribosomal protein L53, mitochondrial [Diachasma alloeum]|uniref:39S ribosomal protein L53, mitochondrial n=1 Tax=Diachasma alloeum TaxID=454923 RepID=UPI0007382567|nr:39S ribosomal protein L53, mitochondrial [Diachasma alloeum]
MSVPFTGRIGRGATALAAISKQLKMMSLKPVKTITVQFDPFYEKIKETRQFLHYISGPKILRTNLTCNLKTNIVGDRSEPTVTCDLTNGEKVLFKCKNLEAIDILKLYNKHITPLAPPEPEPERKGVVVKLKKKKRKIRISRHRK